MESIAEKMLLWAWKFGRHIAAYIVSYFLTFFKRFSSSRFRTPVWTTDAGTTQPVKQVLLTEDIAAYVMGDSMGKIVKKVSGERDVGGLIAYI